VVDKGGHQRVERGGSVQRSAGAEKDSVARGRPSRRPGPEQRRLADSGLTLDDHELNPAVLGACRCGVEPVAFAVPADEAPD